MSATPDTKQPCTCGLPDDPGDGGKMQSGRDYWIVFCDRCGRFRVDIQRPALAASHRSHSS